MKLTVGLVTALVLCPPSLTHALRAQKTPQQQGAGCGAEIRRNSYPRVQISHKIGYGSAGYYFKTDMDLPEPIPIGFTADDGDKIQLWCGIGCVERDTQSGPFTATWTLESPGGLFPGTFAAPSGLPTSTVQKADNVLFLPPTDIPPGYTQQVIVVALIVDRCAIDNSFDSQKDCTITRRFEINVVRLPDGKYEVVGGLQPPNDCAITPMGCGPQLLCCKTVGDMEIQEDPEDLRTKIQVSITEHPDRMCLQEVRPFNAFGEDIDKWVQECGHGAPYPTCTEVNLYDQLLFCDEVTFLWEVDDSSTGSGEFIRQGRTALFRATEKGLVIVTVTIRDENTQEILTSEPIEFDVGDYEEHEILLKSFISCEVVPNPNPLSDYTFFGGDARGAGYALGADFGGAVLGSRAAQKVVVTVDPEEFSIVEEQAGFGATKGYTALGIVGPFSSPCAYELFADLPLGMATQTSLLAFDEGPALPPPPVGNSRRFLLTVEAANPLEPLSAFCPIYVFATVDLKESCDDAWYRLGGVFSKFPFHELYLDGTQVGLLTPSDPDDATLLCEPRWLFPIGTWIPLD